MTAKIRVLCTGYRMLQLLQLPLQDLTDTELRQALTDISNS